MLCCVFVSNFARATYQVPGSGIYAFKAVVIIAEAWMNSSMDCIVCQSLEMDYVIASCASVSLDCKFTVYFASLPLIVMMFMCRLIKHPAKLWLLLLPFADTCVCFLCVSFSVCINNVCARLVWYWPSQNNEWKFAIFREQCHRFDFRDLHSKR